MDIERGFNHEDDMMSDVDDEERSKRRNEMMDIMYTVCINYSEDMIMNQRFLRPTKAERQRNIFDKFTLSNVLGNEAKSLV